MKWRELKKTSRKYEVNTSYSIIIDGIPLQLRSVNKGWVISIVSWSSHQPHDNLSLALCLLTNYRQRSASRPQLRDRVRASFWGALLTGSIRESADHISPEYQSLNFNAHRDINNTHWWYFRWRCLEHGGGWRAGGAGPWGQSTQNRAVALECNLKNTIGIRARAEIDDYISTWDFYLSLLYFPFIVILHQMCPFH